MRVAQTSKSAVSRISKSAGRDNVSDVAGLEARDTANPSDGGSETAAP
jgi:hypothetical protein